jgi:hypothetical protein
MIVDIVDKYCTDDNNPIKKPTLEKRLICFCIHTLLWEAKDKRLEPVTI